MTAPLSVPSPIPDSVTVCITSCGRLDLLAETLRTLAQFHSFGRVLLSEDSGDADVVALVGARYPQFRIFSGAVRLGMMGSIDRLYAAVDTPYIFHLEDDWAFDGPVDWQPALALLDSRPDVANVSLRAFDEIKSKYRAKSDLLRVGHTEFRIMRAAAHPEFFGWSSNPGLILTDLYRRYAPFGRLMHDQMSAEMKRDGLTMAYMMPGVARHIGHGRSMTDPTIPARPKSRPAKWMRAIRKKLYYAGWRKHPF